MTTDSSIIISLDPLLVLVAASCGGLMHDLLLLRGGRWRNVNILGDCEDVNLRLPFAHELSTNTVSEPSDDAMRSHTI